MEILVNKRKRSPIAHLWTGYDTACRQWSTGGIKAKKQYAVLPDNSGHFQICTMCAAVHIRVKGEAV